jgi:hypothetical protein
MKPAMERQSIREATSEEEEYILKLDSFAENIETDGVSIFWSEEGTSAQFSTQMPNTETNL